MERIMRTNLENERYEMNNKRETKIKVLQNEKKRETKKLALLWWLEAIFDKCMYRKVTKSFELQQCTSLKSQLYSFTLK